MVRRTLLGLLFCILPGALLAQAGQFLQASLYPVGASPSAVAVGDFNGDGIPDIAVANLGSNTVSIFLGNGAGTFSPAPNCSATTINCVTGSAPKGIVVADFNGDGHLDIAVTDSGSHYISVLLGNGDGTFQPKVDFPTGTAPWGIAVGDFNGDGIPDIAVTDPGDNRYTLSVLIGQGTGASWTLAPQVLYQAGLNASSVAVGDVNNDGIQDLVVANDNGNNLVSVFLGVGNGTFQTQDQDPTGNTPISVALADLKGDGNLDIVTADYQGNTVSILFGNGTGTFSAPTEYPVGLSPTSVATGDFNGDGIPDIAVSNGDGNTVTVLWGVGNGTFQRQVNLGTGDVPNSIAVGNFTSNGMADIVATNNGSNSISVILSNGRSNTFQARADYAAGVDPYSIASADFNGDGIPDLAVGDYSAGTISIEFGNGDGTFQLSTTTYSVGSPRAIAVGNFNGGNIPDLAIADYSSGTVTILIGEPNGSFSPALDSPITVGSDPDAIVAGDFNGDGIPDLAVANFGSGTVSVLLGNGSNGNGNGTFTPATGSPITVGSGPVSLAAVYLAGSGNLDLIVANENSPFLTVLKGNGDGTFTQPPTQPTVGANAISVVAGNFTGNGIPDLAVAFSQSPSISVLIGNGDGTFGTAVSYPVGTFASSILSADFNGDGKPDLAVTGTPSASYPGNVVSLLLGKGDGTFGTTGAPPTLFGVGFLPYSAVVGDFNGDGANDLAVANSGSNTVSVLLNAPSTVMSTVSSGSPSSYGQSVTFTTSVAAGASTGTAPTGTVTIENGSSIIGSGSLANGTFSLSTSTLPVGSNSISAVYSGDSNYQPHTISLTQIVQQAATTTGVISSPNPSQPNQSVTFTASVQPSTSGSPTGTITFFDGTTKIGSSPVSGGQAALTIGTLSVGTHTITADYSGNGNFTASNSMALNQVVGQATTMVALTASPSPAGLNQNVTLTATVTSIVPNAPTGSVTFMDGTAQLGTATLSGSGIATFSTSALTVGTHNLTAAYSGGGNYLASTSAILSLAVAAPGFTLSPSSVSLSVAPGASATSTIKITPSGGLNPSQVALTCSISPATAPAPTCSLGSITVANNAGSSTLTVTAAGSQAKLDSPADSKGYLALGLIIPAILLGGAGFRKPSATKLLSFCLMFMVLGACFFEVACSSAGQATNTSRSTGSSGTPAGAYTVTVTGTSDEVQTQTATISLTVQ